MDNGYAQDAKTVLRHSSDAWHDLTRTAVQFSEEGYGGGIGAGDAKLARRRDWETGGALTGAP